MLYESDGTYQLVYTYDYDGTILRFYYDANIGDSVSGADYFYLRNQQGDITTIMSICDILTAGFLVASILNML